MIDPWLSERQLNANVFFYIRKVQFFKVPYRGTCLEKKSRDKDIQFIWDLSLRVGDVHMLVVVQGKPLFRLS
jgi:hypothetical protein